MLEDIALTRVLPGMVVVVPGDSVEAEKATRAIAQNDKPSYLRLAREKTPIFSTEDSPFELGVAYVLHEGHDVSLIGTGTMTHTLLMVARALEAFHISAEVVHVPTIKPLDSETILASVRKTGRVVTAEEAQIVGGLGGAIAELLGDELPTPLKRLGVHERFGESGSPKDIFPAFGLDTAHITETVRQFVGQTPKYHQGF
jgi:transketolase